MRCPIILILLIYELSGNKTAVVICTLIGLGLLANAFVSLVTFYHAIMTACTNIHGTTKIILLKISVVLIVLQGLIVQSIALAGNTNLSDDEDFSAKGKAFRIYYFVVLLEYGVLSLIYYNAFSTEMLPSNSVIEKFNRLGKDPNAKPHINFNEYLYQVCFRIDDVFSNLELNSSDGNYIDTKMEPNTSPFHNGEGFD